MIKYTIFSLLIFLLSGCPMGGTDSGSPQVGGQISVLKAHDGSTCQLPAAINGEWQYLRVDSFEGQIAGLVCSSHFELSSLAFDNEISCRYGYLSGAIPECVPSCELRTDPHGTWRWRSSTRKTQAELKCDSGYRIDETNNDLITSKFDYCANGVWESDVYCEPKTGGAPRAGCQFIADPIIGKWTYDRTVPPLSHATMTCPQHATIFPFSFVKSKRIYCRDENWPLDIPRCVWQDCPDSLTDAHGTWIGTNNEGSSSELICDFGYRPSGTGTRKCSKGVWQPPMSVCELDPTPKQKELCAEADLISEPNGTWKFNPNNTAFLICSRGYEGSAAAICHNGKWTAVSNLGKPFCRAKQCIRTDSHGTWTTATHGNQGTLTCHSGATIRSASGQLTSQSSAQVLCDNGFYAMAPTCVLGASPPKATNFYQQAVEAARDGDRVQCELLFEKLTLQVLGKKIIEPKKAYNQLGLVLHPDKCDPNPEKVKALVAGLGFETAPTDGSDHQIYCEGPFKIAAYLYECVK